MNVELVVTSGSKAGQSIPIRVPKFFVGRAEDCHLRPRSDLVSRHHCVILVEDDYVGLRDFGSKNGTYVNNNRVSAEHPLKAGDVIRIGQLEMEVRLQVQVGGEKKPKVTSVQEAAVRAVESAAAQSQAAESDDADLGDWFGGADEATAMPQEETRTIELTAAAGDTAESAVSEETVSAAEREAEHRIDPGKKTPPGGPKRGTSRDAAADLLRNFFKGR